MTNIFLTPIFTKINAFVGCVAVLGLLTLCVGCGTGKGTAGKITDTQANIWRIGFYNVENLYDTEDNPRTKDDDFLPAGKLQWTAERYQKKVKNNCNILSFDKLPLALASGQV